MRALLCLPLLLLAGTSLEGRQPGVVDQAITAAPVALDPADPARRQIGALRYLGGWVLSSRDARFGGISSLSFDGRGFLGITDNGSAIRFALHDGRIRDAVIGDLPGGPGAFLLKHDRDSEAHVVAPDGRHVWVAFERANAIWRYDGALTHAEAHVAPAAMAGWPVNGGAEAMVRFPDGRLLVLSESAEGPVAGSRDALIFDGDPTEPGPPPLRFGYIPPEGYAATSAERLPDGRLLILNRRFTVTEGVSAILTIVDPGLIRAGAAVKGEELARLAAPLTVDNMEGMVVLRQAGRTVVWLVSDDNFLPIQRTLLLSFALDAPAPDMKKPGAR
jgi:hypothetical protein